MKSRSDATWWWWCGLHHIFSTFLELACGRPTTPPVIVPHISRGLLSAPLHRTSFCSKGRHAQAVATAANCRCVLERGGDYLSVTSETSQSLLLCSRSCWWSSGSTGTYGVNVGGKIFSCLGGRWRNVDARRLVSPQVKQQWKQLWPDFESGGKKAE